MPILIVALIALGVFGVIGVLLFAASSLEHRKPKQHKSKAASHP